MAGKGKRASSAAKVVVVIRVMPEEYAALHQLAHQRSIDAGVNVSMTSLLREWIREHARLSRRTV